jgi:hypothetical protein
MKRTFAIGIFLSVISTLLGANVILAEPLDPPSIDLELASIDSTNEKDVSLLTDADLILYSKLNISESENDLSIGNADSFIAQSTTNLKKQPIGWSQREFAVPDSPGSKLIGSSTTKIPNISTPGALITNLLNGVNSDGKFATGISIDTIPYLLFRGSGVTLEEYQTDGLSRFLSNTSLSIATSKEPSSETTRLGVGLQVVLINNGDRRMSDEYLKRLEGFAASVTQDAGWSDLSKEEQNKKIAAQLQKFKESDDYVNEISRLEKEPIWTAAVGTSFLSSTGRYSDLRGDGAGFWTTYRQGIGGNSQLIFHGSYRNGERISDQAGGFFSGDTILLGTRLRMGDQNNSKFSLEATYNIENRQGNPSNSYLSFGAGLEQKIIPKENLWVVLTFAVDPGRQNGGDFRFNSGLRWEFGSQGNI